MPLSSSSAATRSFSSNLNHADNEHRALAPADFLHVFSVPSRRRGTWWGECGCAAAALLLMRIYAHLVGRTQNNYLRINNLCGRQRDGRRKGVGWACIGACAAVTVVAVLNVFTPTAAESRKHGTMMMTPQHARRDARRIDLPAELAARNPRNILDGAQLVRCTMFMYVEKLKTHL